MTTRLRLSLAAGLIAIAGAALVAQDGPPQGPGPRMGGPFRGGPMGPGPIGPGPMGLLGDLGPGLRLLDLSEDQHQQIRTIMESHRDELKPVADRMRAAREGMRALIEADAIDENAIRAKSLEVAAVEADQIILGAKVRAEVLTVLTPEQQQKLKELRAAMRNRGQVLRGSDRF